MKVNSKVVSVGSQVVVRTGQMVRVLSIVHGPGDPARQAISKISPMGRALLGHQINDRVTVEIPAGQQEYEIIDVIG